MKPHNTKKLSKLFVDTILKHNQHVTMITVGRTGVGKSYANLRLAYECACELAERKGGTWKDYFSIDNVVVIELDKAFETLRNMQKYQIYIFDDIGVGWSARKWKDVGNQALNDIFQTFRTKNCILLLTLPDTFLIDKVPRSLVHYFAEMEMSIFDYGITLAKVFKVVRHPRSGDINYPYLRENGSKYIRYAFSYPPEELVRTYDPIREEVANKLIEQRIDKYRDMKEGNSNNGKGKIKGVKKWQRVPVVEEMLEKGVVSSVREGCEMVGISPDLYYKAKRGEVGKYRTTI
jgi:hypothetical protein